jgi:hypothetical protein
MKRGTYLFLYLLFSTSLFAQPMNYTFTTGEKINVDQIANVQVNQDVMGMKMAMRTIISNSLIMEVASVEGDVAKLKSWYSNVAMDFTVDMGAGEPRVLHVNSTEAPEEPELLETHKLVKSMIDSPFFIYLNSNGTILKIEGMDVIEANMRAAVTDESVLNNLGKDFSQEKLRADFARFFVPYPSKELAQGDGWTSTISIPDLQLIDGDQSWKVDRINPENNTVDLIALVKDITLDTTENEVHMKLVGDMTTAYTVNATTGWSELISINSDMTGTAAMSQDGEEYKWPVEMKINSTISMKKN